MIVRMGRADHDEFCSFTLLSWFIRVQSRIRSEQCIRLRGWADTFVPVKGPLKRVLKGMSIS